MFAGSFKARCHEGERKPDGRHGWSCGEFLPWTLLSLSAWYTLMTPAKPISKVLISVLMNLLLWDAVCWCWAQCSPEPSLASNSTCNNSSQLEKQRKCNWLLLEQETLILGWGVKPNLGLMSCVCTSKQRGSTLEPFIRVQVQNYEVPSHGLSVILYRYSWPSHFPDFSV